ncbi:MAG: flippase-like domain-containing protein [Candidatus Omnitrophica bacterium]|nr:flippase-like domain-containing protein [Candidatus Omnitrophota bacterium]
MRNKLHELSVYLKQTKATYFLYAVLLFLFIIVILSIRLKKIMEFQELSLPLSNVVYLSLIGFFFNNFLPTSVAGDFVKAYYTARYTNRTMESYTSIIVDRIFGIFAFVFITVIALFLADRNIKKPIVTNSIVSLVIISLCLILVLSNDNFTKRLHKLLEKIKLLTISSTLQHFFKTVSRYNKNYRIIFFAFYTSVLSQIISTLVVAILAKGLSIEIPLMLLFLTLPIITTVSMLPSLNGLGIRESAYVFLLGNYIGKEKAFALSILWLGIILLVSFFGGIAYLFKDFLLNKKGEVNVR